MILQDFASAYIDGAIFEIVDKKFLLGFFLFFRIFRALQIYEKVCLLIGHRVISPGVFDKLGLNQIASCVDVFKVLGVEAGLLIFERAPFDGPSD